MKISQSNQSPLTNQVSIGVIVKNDALQRIQQTHTNVNKV